MSHEIRRAGGGGGGVDFAIDNDDDGTAPVAPAAAPGPDGADTLHPSLLTMAATSFPLTTALVPQRCDPSGANSMRRKRDRDDSWARSSSSSSSSSLSSLLSSLLSSAFASSSFISDSDTVPTTPFSPSFFLLPLLFFFFFLRLEERNIPEEESMRASMPCLEDGGSIGARGVRVVGSERKRDGVRVRVIKSVFRIRINISIIIMIIMKLTQSPKALQTQMAGSSPEEATYRPAGSNATPFTVEVCSSLPRILNGLSMEG